MWAGDRKQGINMLALYTHLVTLFTIATFFMLYLYCNIALQMRFWCNMANKALNFPSSVPRKVL